MAVLKLTEACSFKKLNKVFIHLEHGINNIESDEFLKF
jgi:hypothetical protein